MENPKLTILVYKKQIEGVEGALPARLFAVGGAVVAATLVALFLGSNALLNWVNNLPIGPVSDVLLQGAQNWQNLMAQWGIDQFAAKLGAGLTAFQSLHW